MGLYKCVSSGGTGLQKRQYVSSNYDTCTIGEYRSGVAITQSASYPHMFIVNVSGISGTLKVSFNVKVYTNISGIKDGVVTLLAHSQLSSSTVTIDPYDFITVTGATGGQPTLSITITES